jgi:hypothetical protein
MRCRPIGTRGTGIERGAELRALQQAILRQSADLAPPAARSGASALDERPSTLTLVGGAIEIAAIVIQARGAPPSDAEDEPALPAAH